MNLHRSPLEAPSLPIHTGVEFGLMDSYFGSINFLDA